MQNKDGCERRRSLKRAKPERRRIAGDSITPEMINAGRRAFESWMNRWDYLSGGAPSDPEIIQLLETIWRSMASNAPSSAR